MSRKNGSVAAGGDSRKRSREGSPLKLQQAAEGGGGSNKLTLYVSRWVNDGLSSARPPPLPPPPAESIPLLSSLTTVTGLMAPTARPSRQQHRSASATPTTVRTAFYHHPDTLRHESFHRMVASIEPERPERISVAMKHLRNIPHLLPACQLVTSNFPQCSTARLRRVHCEAQIDFVDRLEFAVLLSGQKSLTVGTDLYASEGTPRATRIAAGAVVDATMKVVRGEVDNAMVLVRPPGHHSSDVTSAGFCYFNNVAVAARAAMAEFPDVVKKVMILDWDVHHCNGTERIFYDDPNVLVFSIHQYGSRHGHVIMKPHPEEGKEEQEENEGDNGELPGEEAHGEEENEMRDEEALLAAMLGSQEAEEAGQDGPQETGSNNNKKRQSLELVLEPHVLEAEREEEDEGEVAVAAAPVEPQEKATAYSSQFFQEATRHTPSAETPVETDRPRRARKPVNYAALQQEFAASDGDGGKLVQDYFHQILRPPVEGGDDDEEEDDGEEEEKEQSQSLGRGPSQRDPVSSSSSSDSDEEDDDDTTFTDSDDDDGNHKKGLGFDRGSDAYSTDSEVHEDSSMPFYPGTGAAHKIGGDGALDDPASRSVSTSERTSSSSSRASSVDNGSKPHHSHPSAKAMGKNINFPWPTTGYGDLEYLYVLDQFARPIAQEFDPDLILISCGFDCAADDVLGSMKVSPTGFYAMTMLVAQKFFDKEGNGEGQQQRKKPKRIVAALEGGYNVKQVARCSEAVLRALQKCARPTSSSTTMSSDDVLAEVDAGSNMLIHQCERQLETCRDLHRPHWKCLQSSWAGEEEEEEQEEERE